MNMNKYNREEILALYSEELTKTEIAKKYAEKQGLTYSDSVRRNVSKIINEFQEVGEAYYVQTETDDIGGEAVENYTITTGEGEIEDDFVMPSAWSPELNRFLSIEEYCEAYNLSYESLEKYNLVAHNRGHMVYNVRFKPTLKEVSGITEDYIEEIISKYIKPVENKIKYYEINYNRWFDRLVYTDVHLNMNPNGLDGDPIYDGKWDEEEVYKRLDIMVNHVLKFKKSNFLVIDDLGDFMDGFQGETTRGGHKLPQNTNDKEAFDLGINFKIKLVESLIPHFELISCNNVTNDNHAGPFGYFVNSAAKYILETKYPNKVKVNIQKRFMGHYQIGKHTTILCHGKDSEGLKFGFKPHLDPKQAEKIDQYCKEHKLYDGNYIEFSKGDSHQAIFDDTTSNDFDYYSYPAFSPASNWVKLNFKNTKSGFRFYNIDKESQIKIPIPYYFEK